MGGPGIIPPDPTGLSQLNKNLQVKSSSSSSSSSSFFFFFFKILFIYMTAQAGEAAEREEEAGSPLSREPDVRPNLKILGS